MVVFLGLLAVYTLFNYGDKLLKMKVKHTPIIVANLVGHIKKQGRFIYNFIVLSSTGVA